MQRDFRDLEISGADEETGEAVRRFQVDFQGFRDEAAAIFAVAERATGCVTAQLYAAAMAVYTQVSADIDSSAGPLLARAERLAERATERERLLLRAVAAWARSDYGPAADAFEALLGRWPGDVTAVKFAEFVFFEAPDYRRHLRLMESVAPANADLPCFGAMHAFAHELNGHDARAESIAEAALAADPDTPWAHHALGHLYLNTARIHTGRDFLAGVAPSWGAHGVGIRHHNAWHLALLQLATLDVDATVATYREAIEGQNPGSAFQHTDAISLLWRLELCGVAQPARTWAEFVPFALARADDHVMPFLSAHYLYALARAGEVDAATGVVDRLARRAAAGVEPWRTGVALLAGVLAFARDRPGECVERLAPVLDTLPGVGGSDAQNDLFAQTHLVALARSGRVERAVELLARRIGDRPPTPQEGRWVEAA